MSHVLKVVSLITAICIISACNITVENEGGGLVTSTDGNIQCGDVCTFNYESTQVVVLQATPETGFQFDGWSGVCVGTQNCAIEIGAASGSKIVSAIFSEVITPSHSIGGSIVGLMGILELTNNGGDNVLVNSTQSDFVFPIELKEGVGYLVDVSVHPDNQTCSVVNGSGIVGRDTILDIIVECIPGPASPLSTVITASSESVRVGETVLINVVLKDEDGNNTVGQDDVVVLFADGDIDIGTLVDNADGTYSASVSSTEPSFFTFSGTLNGDDISDTAEIEFTGELPTTTGYSLPSTSFNAVWTLPDNVFGDGDSIARQENIGIQEYGDFNISIPQGANVNGITVEARASVAAFTIGSSNLTLQLLGDNGATWTNDFSLPYNCLIICGYTTQVIGGEDNLFGNIWVPGDFNENLFRLNGKATSIGMISGLNVDYIQVKVAYSFLSSINTTIDVNPSDLVADGVSTAMINLQAKDEKGNDYSYGGHSILLSSTGSAIIGAVIDNEDGSYSAEITSTVAEKIVISGIIDGKVIGETGSLTFHPGAADVNNVDISVVPNVIAADGISSATIRVQAVDSLWNLLVTGGASIVLTTTGSAVISSVSDLGDGTYTAQITNTLAESVTINGTIDGVMILDIAPITFIPVL